MLFFFLSNCLVKVFIVITEKITNAGILLPVAVLLHVTAKTTRPMSNQNERQ